jgi:hypothetical protein
VCGQSGTLGRHSSEIRTGCANKRPSGSVRGAISNGCPNRDRQLDVEQGQLPDSSSLRRNLSDWQLQKPRDDRWTTAGGPSRWSPSLPATCGCEDVSQDVSQVDRSISAC